MQELKTIIDLANALRVIPGIGNKSSERIAYEFLKLNPEKIQALISALKNIEKLSVCPICGAYKENEKCFICDDDSRDNKTLIIVCSFKDVLSLERLNYLHVKYHILNGTISPTKGITASDIHLDKLIKRIEQENFEEVILATNPTLDGETTALYIAKMLENYKVKVTRLAYGLPMGANLDFADELTLSRALEGRTTYKK